METGTGDPGPRGLPAPAWPGEYQWRRHTIAQENAAQEHEHKVVEILVCPGDSPLRRDAWVCACGAQRLVDLEGKPAGIWSRMIPVPYANPIGHIDQITQEGYLFAFDNQEDYGALTVGARVAVLRYSRETGAIVKVEGTITAVDHAGARFAVTGSQTGQEDLLREGAPVYLEPAD